MFSITVQTHFLFLKPTHIVKHIKICLEVLQSRPLFTVYLSAFSSIFIYFIISILHLRTQKPNFIILCFQNTFILIDDKYCITLVVYEPVMYVLLKDKLVIHVLLKVDVVTIYKMALVHPHFPTVEPTT